MNRVIFTAIFFLVASSAQAGKCGTSTEILSSKDESLKYDVCITFDKSAGCEFPKQIEIPPKGKVEVLFTYMCGYPSDPSISEYWLMHREVGNKKYSFKKYKQQGLVL